MIDGFVKQKLAQRTHTTNIKTTINSLKIKIS